MRSSVSNIRGRLNPAVFALAGVLCVFPAAAQQRQKIEFSDPGAKAATGGTVVSNLNLLDARSSTARQMQEQLFKPFGPVRSQGPFDQGMQFPIPTQPPMIILGKKEREEIERKKNWALIDMNELSSRQTLESMMGVRQYDSNGKLKDLQTPMEEMYENLTPRKPKNSTTPLAPGEALGGLHPDFAGTNAFSPGRFLPANADGTAGDLLAGAPAQRVNPQAGGAGLWDLKAVRAQQEHLADFQKLLNAGHAGEAPVMRGPDGLIIPLPTASGNVSSLTPLNSPAFPPAEHHSAANPFPPLQAAQAPRPHVFDDLTARALGLPNPPEQKPDLKAAAKTPPPPLMPIAALPQRKF